MPNDQPRTNLPPESLTLSKISSDVRSTRSTSRQATSIGFPSPTQAASPFRTSLRI